MNKYEISDNTWNTVQAVAALTTGDSDAVQDLLVNAVDPAEVSDTLRANASYMVRDLRVGGSRKHSRLWLVPVVIHSEAEDLMPDAEGLKTLPVQIIMKAVREKFKPMTSSKMLQGLLPYSVLSRNSPVETRGYCKSIVEGEPSMHLRLEQDQKAMYEYPTLSFVLGAVSAIDEYPELLEVHRETEVKIQAHINGALALTQGPLVSGEPPANNFLVLPPDDFSEGLFHGIMAWIKVLEKKYILHSVSIKPIALDNYEFTLFLQAGENSEVNSIRWNTKTTQISDARIAEIYQYLDKACTIPLEERQSKIKHLH